MKAFVLAFSVLFAVQPALACHRYAVWRYPWPQRCDVATHAVHHSPTEPKDWYVEIVLTPQVMDEISHAVGIEKIKQLNHTAGE